MSENSKKNTKPKAPTALKRLKQSEKKQLVNKMFKSRVRTAVRSFESSCKEKNQEAAKENLNQVYSLFDKGVKRGIFKKNKADRSKSRLSAKIASI